MTAYILDNIEEEPDSHKSQVVVPTRGVSCDTSGGKHCNRDHQCGKESPYNTANGQDGRNLPFRGLVVVVCVQSRRCWLPRLGEDEDDVEEC